jgi:hypothetical protein
VSVGIIVTGWRGPLSSAQAAKVTTAVDMYFVKDAFASPVLYEGSARGVDKVVSKHVFDRGFHVRTFKAEWRAHGKAAGPRRNRQMCLAAHDTHDVVLCLAFPHPTKSVGTWDCIQAAVSFEISCHIFPIKIEDT